MSKKCKPCGRGLGSAVNPCHAKKVKPKKKRLVGKDVKYSGMKMIFGDTGWLPEGKFTTCALAKKRTESPQGYGTLLKYGLIEVKYVEEPSKSRPGETSCRVYSRATSKKSHTLRGR